MNTPPIIQSEDYRTIYSNAASLSFTPWDFRFTFSQLVDKGAREAVVQDEACVVLSPQHAKVMVEMLQTTVAQYEAQFGVIPLILGNAAPPKDIVAQQKKLSKKAAK